MLKKFLIAVLALAFLSACQYGGPRQSSGTLIGGATGALVGSQIGGGDGKLVAVAIGTLLGAHIGSEIGKQMDEQDRRLAMNNAQHALEHAPDNRANTWHNPNNNHSGNFVVNKTQEYPQSSKVCRDYTHTVFIDGKQQTVHGRACRDMRDAKGEWMVQG